MKRMVLWAGILAGQIGLLVALWSCNPLSEDEGRLSAYTSPTDANDATLEDLVHGLDWRAWYRQTSGYAPDPRHFGAYVTLGVGDDLYIGLGTGLPSLGDGALVARFDGARLVSVGALAEEGIHEIVWDPDSGTLHIAGTDPSWPDDWSAGNHYTFEPAVDSTIHKHRDPENGLVNVMHTWGLWLSEDHVLYAAVNAQDGSFVRDSNIFRRILDRIYSTLDDSYYATDYGVTRTGQVYKTTDDGSRWRYVSDIGYFRAYDVIGYHDRLYAIYADTPEVCCKLAASEREAGPWDDVMQVYIQYVHLTPFEDKLLAVSQDGKSIYAITEDEVSRCDLPSGFRVESQYMFHLLAVASSRLYVVAKRDDRTFTVIRTTDLQDWEEVLRTRHELASLSYWPARNSLVLGGTGASAGVWEIPLNRR